MSNKLNVHLETRTLHISACAHSAGVIRRELARQHRGWRTPSGGSPDTTLELSRDYETSNSPDPQDGRAEVSCPDFKRAESAESAESSLIGGVHSLLESAGGSCRDIKRAESAESAESATHITLATEGWCRGCRL